MRVASWNFLSGGSRNRDRHWQLLSEHLRPDLLFTQECRPPAAAAPDQLLWLQAPGRYWGSGLFAREAAIAPIAMRGFKGWVTGGRIDDARWWPGRSLIAFSIHCPAGAHGYVRTMHSILNRLKRLRTWDADLIIGGDLNVACGYREADDVVKMSRAEKELLDRMCGELELMPCWQAANPGKRLAQTLRWSANRGTPYHCDGIFVPAAWRADLRQCDVLSGSQWQKQSDHNPIVAVIEPAVALALS
jgi:exonuclease III